MHSLSLASGLSLDMVFGLDVQPSGKPDPFIHAATQAVEGLAAAGLFGTYVVDYLPLCECSKLSFSKSVADRTQ